MAIRAFLQLKESVYRGPIRKILKKSGLNRLIHRSIDAILESSPKVHSVEMSDTIAKFHITSYTEYLRVNSLVGEEEVLSELIENLESGDVFYDIGANIGIYSSFVMSSTDDVSVFAFEPHSSNISKMRRNLALNGQEWSCIQTAIGDDNKLVPFNIASEDSDDSTHSTLESSSTIQIPQQRLTELVRNNDIPSPSVMKIDVEGAEYAVLKGTQELLEDIRLLICEVHPEKLQSIGVKSSEIEELLMSHGFTTRRLETEAEVFHVIATNKN